jgi:protein associated with RNAse G/E
MISKTNKKKYVIKMEAIAYFHMRLSFNINPLKQGVFNAWPAEPFAVARRPF